LVGASGADGAGGVAVAAAGIGSQMVISSVCGKQERGDCGAAVDDKWLERPGKAQGWHRASGFLESPRG
jgi:hypothetical protein